MAQFESARHAFIERHAGAVFIAAQKIDGLFKGKEHVEKHRYFFPILFDEDRKVTRAYGVHQAIGVDTFNLARRSMFVAGRNGKICSIAVSPHQREAPQIEDVIAAIESCDKY